LWRGVGGEVPADPGPWEVEGPEGELVTEWLASDEEIRGCRVKGLLRCGGHSGDMGISARRCLRARGKQGLKAVTVWGSLGRVCSAWPAGGKRRGSVQRTGGLHGDLDGLGARHSHGSDVEARLRGIRARRARADRIQALCRYGGWEGIQVLPMWPTLTREFGASRFRSLGCNGCSCGLGTALPEVVPGRCGWK